MGNALFQILRVAAVIAIVIFAAALATPKGRLPLAVRGLARMLQRDRGASAAQEAESKVPAWKKAVAFLLVLLAAALSIA